MIHLDTSFIVDLLREERRERFGPAHEMLASLEDEPIALSVFVLCELEHGIRGAARRDAERLNVEAVLRAIEVRYPDERFALRYGEIAQGLQMGRRVVAPMDLLIGVSALIDDASLVTGNAKHFGVIPGLHVLGY